MQTLNLKTLSDLVERRQLKPARPLSVGQLRIATVPKVLRPERAGMFDPRWLEPLAATPVGGRTLGDASGTY